MTLKPVFASLMTKTIRIFSIRVLSGLVLLLVATSSQALDCEQFDVLMKIENDSALTLGGGTDRYYSNGFELFGNCHLDDNQPPHMATTLLKRFNPATRIRRQSFGVMLGQKLFTNSDISLTPDQIDTESDRPYAGWSYAGVAFEAFGEDDAYLKHQFTIGCVGPCSQGEEIQTEWHETFGFREPRGWDLQIEDQPALQYFFEYRPPQHYEWYWFSIQPQFKVSLGTIQTDLSAGGQLRAGDVDLTDQTRLYFFIHNQIKAVIYDATLQGSLFDDDSPHTVDPTRFTIEQGFGLRLDWRRYLFEYKFIASSTQVEQQDWKFWDHKYGSFQFGVAF